MGFNLDEIDRKILRELQEDGRASFRDISSRIGVSTPTVSARVQAMLDIGLIKGYSVNLDSGLLGQTSVALIVDTKPSDLDKVVGRIQDEEIVRQIYVLSNSKILCMLSFYDQSRYKKFLEGLSTIPEITKIENSVVLKAAKEEPRASLTDEAGLLVKCYYCGRVIKDEGVKIKLDGKYHYLCCSVCEKMYREKYDRLKKSIGTIRPHEVSVQLAPVHQHSA